MSEKDPSQKNGKNTFWKFVGFTVLALIGINFLSGD
jgi:hypothetical protein